MSENNETAGSESEARAALVVGGSGDIGRAVAAHLAATGYSVGLVGRSEEKLEEARRQVEGAGPQVVTACCAEIGDEEAVKTAVQQVHVALGRIDVVVNAVGIAEPAFVARGDSDHWERMLRTNLLGAVWVAKAVGPIMRRQKGGQIINIGSWASEEGRAGLAAYSATKGALASLAPGIMRELGRKGVRVSTISPQEVATSMHADDSSEREKMIAPDDIARAVGFLLSLSPTAAVPELFIRRTDALV